MKSEGEKDDAAEAEEDDGLLLPLAEAPDKCSAVACDRMSDKKPVRSTRCGKTISGLGAAEVEMGAPLPFESPPSYSHICSYHPRKRPQRVTRRDSMKALAARSPVRTKASEAALNSEKLKPEEAAMIYQSFCFISLLCVSFGVQILIACVSNFFFFNYYRAVEAPIPLLYFDYFYGNEFHDTL